MTATPAADPKSNPNAPLISASSPHGPDWWLMMKAFLRQGARSPPLPRVPDTWPAR